MIHVALEYYLAANSLTQVYLAGSPNRIYPGVIPQKVPRGATQTPCVVYELRSVDRQVRYCGTDHTIRSVMTLDCYATDYNSAKALAQAVYYALRDFRGQMGPPGDTTFVKTANLETEFDVQDLEPGLYRVSQSWSIWHEEN